MKTVIVTGCNGFIGSKLVGFLLEKNLRVIGLDLNTSKIVNDNFYFYKLDLASNLIDLLVGYNADTLYHLSWNGVSTADKNNPDKQFFNIGLTYNILVLANNLGVKKIVIPGSMSEFSKNYTAVTGNERDTPSDLYAATKVAIRKIAYQFAEKNNVDLNWALITSVYGPGRNDNNLITSCIKNILSGKKVETTKLEQRWDYIYIDDLIKALYYIGEFGHKNSIYPVGSGEVHELGYYVDVIMKKMNCSDYSGIGIIPYKNEYIDNSIPNIELLQRDTSFVADNKFSDAIDVVINYFESLGE